MDRLRGHRMVGGPLALIVGMAIAAACVDPTPSAPEPPPIDEPAGPGPMVPETSPVVEVTPRGGDGPLRGTVRLVPPPGAADWQFAADLDEDGRPEHEGPLPSRVELGYVFDEIGIHHVRVSFTRRDETVTIERGVFVFDPSWHPDLPILAVNVVDVPEEDLGFEGITEDRAGEAIYVASYRGGQIFPLDASDLRSLGRSDRVGPSIEGLAVSPSNRFLFARLKQFELAVLELPSLKIVRIVGSPGRFYVHALDDTRVVVDGGLLDTAFGTLLGSFFSSEQHFAVSPGGDLAAGLVPEAGFAGRFLQLVDLGSLAVVDSFPMPEFISYGESVAFHPSGERIYVVAIDAQRDERLLVFDTHSGRLLRNLVLGPHACFALCVANPVATSRDGRWVVFAREYVAYFIDTVQDLPVHRITGFGSGVAASATEDAFYFLNGYGVVTKVPAP